MYEMLTGAAPFYSQDRTLMFRNRTEKPTEMKPWFSEACSSLLTGLLNNNVNTFYIISLNKELIYNK